MAAPASTRSAARPPSPSAPSTSGTPLYSTGTFVQTGGTVTTATSDQYGTYIGDFGNGVFNISGGSYSAYDIIISEIGSGTINQTGGTFNAGQFEPTHIGTTTLSAGLMQQLGIPQPVATINLSGGTFVTSATILGGQRHRRDQPERHRQPDQL